MINITLTGKDATFSWPGRIYYNLTSNTRGRPANSTIRFMVNIRKTSPDAFLSL